MALRTRAPAPIPKADLRALLDRLPTAYASRLWYGDGQAVLVARVPRTEPDLIEDVERVVERAHPDHVQEADQCLLVGTQTIHGVPMTPLKALMADRVAFDRQQCAMLRTQLAQAPSHTRYRSPDDPHRRLRLALRVPGAHVADAEEEDLDIFVDRLGPLLDVGELDGLHCVYVLADEDEVRLEADAFLADLLEKWRDPQRQQRLAEARRARQEERDRKASRETRESGSSNEGTLPAASERAEEAGDAPEEGVAPPPHPGAPQGGTGPAVAETPRPVAEAEHRFTTRSDDDLRSIQHQVDALGAEDDGAPGPTVPQPAADGTRRPVPAPLPHEDTGSPGLDRLRAVLDRHGFDVLVRPDVPDHPVDLAAERPDGDPQRIIAVEREVLDDDGAQALLAAGRALEVDQVLVLCDEITPDARRRLVATKVRTLGRDDLADLRL